MNGGAGDRRNGLWVIDFTAKGAPSRPAATARASVSPSTTTESGDLRTPSSSKSRPVASDTPSRDTREAVKEVGTPSDPADPAAGAGPAADAARKVPSRPHQSADRKAIRARSRSTTIRVATLWTRPAESRGMIFFHRTGDTS